MNPPMMFRLFVQKQLFTLNKIYIIILNKPPRVTNLNQLFVVDLIQVNMKLDVLLTQVNMKSVVLLAQVNMKSVVLLMVTITNRMIMDMMMKVTTMMRIPTIHVLSLATVRDQGLHLSISIVVKKSISITKRGPVVSLMQTMNQDLFPISILHLNHLLIIALEILVVFPTIR